MKSFAWAVIGAFWDPADRYAPYYREALEHAGIPFACLDTLGSASLAEYDVLLLCGYGELPETTAESVREWTEAGGQLIASGSAWGLEDLIGLEGGPRHVSRGKLKKPTSERLWPTGLPDLTFFGGSSYGHAGHSNTSLRTEDGSIAFVRRHVGNGHVAYFAPHVGQTVYQMQLGRSVEADGVGACDGSARLDDGVLRAEDGTSLDFELDRESVGGCKLFATPFADGVKEVWLRAVVEAAERTGKQLPVLWYWPRNAPGAAVLSIECPTYDDHGVQRIQRALSLIGCRPVWLVGLPGFTLDVYRSFRNWEQEIGLLFCIEEGLSWHEERMKIQHVALGRAAGVPYMISARPEDGKWQGWLNFYEMCEGAGARMSLAKGGRQPGTSGYLFGTCHPFFPLKRDGSPFLACELPYAAFMPSETHGLEASESLIARALAVNGCYHAVLHLGHPGYDRSVDAVRRLLSLCRQKHLEFLKPEEVYRFEKAKRSLRVYPKASLDQGALTLVADQDLEGLTILFFGPSISAHVHGKPANLKATERFGAKAQFLTISLESKKQLDIALELTELERAA